MNTRSVLVAYATRYGSTQEVAEAIAAALREAGLEVEVRPLHQVKALDDYDAIVLGAAIYNGRWHPDAHQFLSQREGMIRQLPAAIFALGPLSTGDAAMARSRRQLEGELKRYPWLKPVALAMFAGKLDPTKLGFFDRLLSPASDNRDWNAIRAWANALPAQLQHAAIPHPA